MLVFAGIRIDCCGRVLLPEACENWEVASTVYDTERDCIVITRKGDRESKLDRKRRLVIPKDLRVIFGEEENLGMVRDGDNILLVRLSKVARGA
jgi:hypothetical protein